MKKLFLLVAFLTCASISVLGQAPPPITWTEEDGTPRKTGVSKIVLSNGVLSCSGSTCTINISGASGLSDPGSNGLVVRTALGITTARTLTAGAGISVSNGTGVSGNPTVTWDGSTFVNNITLWDSANASRTLTAGLSGATDPVITFSDGVVNVSTGALQVGGAAVLTAASTATLTNKTYNTAGSGNTFQIAGTSITAISGNTGTVATTTGTLTSGRCVEIDANGNLVQSSGGCGGSGSPGGSDTQVQYNNASSFGGISGFTSDGTNVTAGSGNLRATRPRFITSIDDTNGNEVFVVTATGSAVNEITVANAATGGNPTMTASGGDTNIGIDFTPKAAAAVSVRGNATQAGEFRLYEDTDDGTNYAAFKAQAMAGNLTWTLPATDSTGSQCLASNGSGTLSWTACSGSGSPAGSSGDYQINNGGSFGAGVIAQSSGRLTATPSTISSGTTSYFRIITPADTGITADTESIGIQLGGNTSAATVTRTLADGTTLATQREYVFVAPTYAAAGATTITNAVTVDITGAPTAGSNITQTNSYALRVGGNIALNGGTNSLIGNTYGSLRMDGSVGVVLTGNTSTLSITNSALSLNFAGGAAEADVFAGLFRLGSDTKLYHSSTTPDAMVHFKSNAAGTVGLRVDSASSPSTDIVQFTNNGTNVFQIGANGTLTQTPAARTSGSAAYTTFNTPADTAQTASTESVGVYFGGNGSGSTVTRQWSTGALTTQRENVFVAPTYSFVGASTLTTAATVAITGAPTAGTNATITTPIGLLIDTASTTALGVKVQGSGNHSVEISANNATPFIRLYGTNTSVFTYLRQASGGGFNMGLTHGMTFTDGGFTTNYMGVSTTVNIGNSVISSTAAQLHVASQSTTRVGLRADSLANSTVDLAQFNLNADDTNSVANLATFAANSNGTAATGFGSSFTWTLESSTTNDQNAASLGVLWTDATHASRTSAIAFSTVSAAGSLTERARVNELGVRIAAVTHTNLGTPTDGQLTYCSDCTVTSGADNTCASGGSGALAVRLNGVWRCFNTQN